LRRPPVLSSPGCIEGLIVGAKLLLLRMKLHKSESKAMPTR
jgi:hypothetical protein